MTKVTKQRRVRKARKPKSDSGSLLDNVTDINFESEGLKVAVYGRSGTGKTTLWGTFPKPILAIVCSGGKRSGELRSISNVDGIKVYNLTDTTEIPELCSEVASSNYETVVLDHVTYLADLRIKEVLGVSEVPVQKSWGLVSQQQYGQVAITMKEYLRHLIDLPQNVVIVGQERDFNTEADSELLMPYVGVALSPSVVGWLNPAVDYIVQTFIRQKVVIKEGRIGKKQTQRKVPTNQVEYCLRTGPHAVFTTKFRTPKGHELPDVIVDPDYDKLKDVITGGTKDVSTVKKTRRKDNHQ